MDEIRIVVLGETGAGKSSLGNTIFGENVFKINHTANSETNKCQKQTVSVNERRITLIDTPGFFETDKSEEEMRSEIVKCITECAPGPHAFLIVLKVDKFIVRKRQIIDKIKQYFSKDAFKYSIVVFTHGDQLPEEMKIEQFIKEDKCLRDLVRKCGGRYHVVDNKYWNNQQDEYRNNNYQVEKLLKTIEAMVVKGGYYTNKMIQEVERKIQEEEKKIRESSENMSDEDIRERANSKVSIVLKTIACITTGGLLGALLSVPVMIVTYVILFLTVERSPQAGVGLEGLAIFAAVIAGVGAVIGGYVGFDEVDQADSVGMAVKNTVKAVLKPFKC